ncbi:MAG: hypothetical protein HOI23_05550 [Deltaproteobacteria bacterium]|jgi:hypothetical protein|nr:hypothetical protein [Deltaproteobacteria bacterium]
MILKLMALGIFLLQVACGDAHDDTTPTDSEDTSSDESLDEDNNDENLSGNEADTTTDETADGFETSSNMVTFTVYIDENCTELPPSDSAVHLDTTNACNVAPKASMSDLVCYADKITYTNYPNILDCSGEGFFNELLVGVCQEFPGPVRTWKYIEPSTYNCITIE